MTDAFVPVGPAIHAADHATGGADAFTSTQTIEAVCKRLRETGGPTILALGAVADNQYLQRSGATVVGAATAAPTAHNLLSASHGDTLAASVVRGDVVVGNSTPAWSRLAVGADGRFLRANGTDPSWAVIGESDLPATVPFLNVGNEWSIANEFIVTDTGATALATPLLVTHRLSSGTAGAGMAVGLLLYQHNATGVTKTAGEISAAWTDATNGSEDSDVVLRAMLAGTLTETARFTDNALRLGERSSDPTAVANKGFIYTKDTSGVTQLYYRDDAGTVTQLTPGTGDAAGRVLRYLAFAA